MSLSFVEADRKEIGLENKLCGWLYDKLGWDSSYV